MKHLLMITVVLFTWPTFSNANNIAVSNISITGQNVSAGLNNAANFSLIKFDVSWENSWRSAALNWDAAWIFIKYRVNGGPWNHCNLNNTGHTAPSGSTIDAGLVDPATAFHATTNPAVGAFIYRNADGSGNVNFQNIHLRWNYGSQGVLDAAVLDVQVFALEMVYVPTGTFAVGDAAVDGFNEFGQSINTRRFVLTTINTGNASIAPSGTGSLGGQAGGYPTGRTAQAANWPNGFNAFYCMKYEITQGFYRDFLNTLTYAQQVGRTHAQGISTAGLMAFYVGSTVSDRNGIRVQIPGVASTNTPAVFGCDLDGNNVYNSTTDGEWIACNYLTNASVSTILDWSGLRMMTDMEYEKACRGTVAPVQREYAWGTNVGSILGPSMQNAGTSTEVVTNGYATSVGVGNYFRSGIYRVGSIAASSNNTSGRITSGATFYGIMEMTGNVGEICIPINSTILNGDGVLNTSYTYQGEYLKGILASSSSHPRSDEVSSRHGPESGFQWIVGGRGVRTAP